MSCTSLWFFSHFFCRALLSSGCNWDIIVQTKSPKGSAHSQLSNKLEALKKKSQRWWQILLGTESCEQNLSKLRPKKKRKNRRECSRRTKKIKVKKKNVWMWLINWTDIFVLGENQLSNTGVTQLEFIIYCLTLS